MPLLPVRIDQGAGLGIDQTGNLLPEQLIAKLDVGLLLDAAQELRRHRHHPGKAEIAETEARHRIGKLEELANGKVATA